MLFRPRKVGRRVEILRLCTVDGVRLCSVAFVAHFDIHNPSRSTLFSISVCSLLLLAWLLVPINLSLWRINII